MYIDPYYIQWAILITISIVAFHIGRLTNYKKTSVAIEDTIQYLIDHNFVRSEIVDGQVSLIELEDKD